MGQQLAGPSGLLISVINAPENLTQLTHQGVEYLLERRENPLRNDLYTQLDCSQWSFNRVGWSIADNDINNIDPWRTEQRLTTTGRHILSNNTDMPRSLFDQRQLRQQQESLRAADAERTARLQAVATEANIRENPAIQNTAGSDAEIEARELPAPETFRVRLGENNFMVDPIDWERTMNHQREMERSMIDRMRGHQDAYNMQQLRIDTQMQLERDRENSRRLLEMMTPATTQRPWVWDYGMQQQIQNRPVTIEEAFIAGADPYYGTQSAPVDGQEYHVLSEPGVRVNRRNVFDVYFNEAVRFFNDGLIVTEPEVRETDPKFSARFEEEDPF